MTAEMSENARMRFEPDELRTLSILEGLSGPTLSWLSDRGVRIDLAVGDRMFSRGEPADSMFIVVRGTVERYEEVGGQWLVVATTTRGQVTGMLPYSRMTHYPGHAVAAEASEVLRLAKSDFDDMLAGSHELGQRLVAEMSNRVRGDVRLEQQRDKMMALGRLSAGLAHELNNPAAAIRRTVANLREQLTAQRSRFATLSRPDIDEAVVGKMQHLLAIASGRGRGNLSPIELSEREDAMTDWLEAHSVPEPWDSASVLAASGFLPEDLEETMAAIPESLLPDLTAWVVASVEVDRMVSEITSAAERISDLVSSVKTYSHMDRSAEHKPTDIRSGLDNTLTIMQHRITERGILLTREYADDLPQVPGNAGELNQVWTNLIDNAIDAMDDGGALSIEACRDDWGVVVRIVDNGKGIPAEIRERIFDPFFTTKDVGQGTGLGLDIARRIVRTHRGQIEVRSMPGRTEMRVRLPAVSKEGL